MAEKRFQYARDLLEEYGTRTGITAAGEDESRRYLWTDAFAVQAFFSLGKITGEEAFQQHALHLIELVHKYLGRFHPDDNRQGPISGLDEKQAESRPTAGGLRIGKSLPERREDESYNSRLEWERDGQYFHYITRWITALLRAYRETGEEKYLIWALELFLAGGNFVYEQAGRFRMYWKMDTTLSRALVPSMGAHDPLEGLLCGKSIQLLLPQQNPDLDRLVNQFEAMCTGMEWDTPDPLGIGALLLNTIKAAQLKEKGSKIPPEALPERLLDESLLSLRRAELPSEDEPASRRLAFRECGLSLGINACIGKKEELAQAGLDPSGVGTYAHLADEIEDFWLEPPNRKSGTWKDHLDINAVTLAASLIGDRFLD